MKGYEGFLAENYQENERIVKRLWVSLIGFAILIAYGLLFGFAYYLLWGNPFQGYSFDIHWLNIFTAVVFVLIYLGFCIFHDLLQGIIWSKYTDVKIKILIDQSIVRFCYCEKVIKINKYIVGLFTPTILLSLVPALTGIIVGSFYVLLFGIVMMGAGCYSFYVLFLLRKIKPAWIKHMDRKEGYIIYSLKNGLV